MTSMSINDRPRSRVPQTRVLPRGRPKARRFNTSTVSQEEIQKMIEATTPLRGEYEPTPHQARIKGDDDTTEKERPYECSQCPAAFMKKGHLMTHRFVHARGAYVCKICNRTFNFRFNLVRHVKMHSGIRPYVCKVCNYAFNLKGNLQIHFRVHTKIKPFACPVCSRAFTMKQNRDTHMRTHSVYMPHNCTHCGVQFTSRALLKVHQLTMHRFRHVLCDTCGSVFRTRNDYIAHEELCRSRRKNDGMNATSQKQTSNRGPISPMLNGRKKSNRGRPPKVPREDVPEPQMTASLEGALTLQGRKSSEESSASLLSTMAVVSPQVKSATR
eukprot:CAMPEP_0184491488 /NCGR_PEP_ID=MMETSP0113_2-20130426/20534_1 /TAXON_ID=91329 /ORGANISM="Norrisiella sphaerica, Strain BC52" /LENGTH=327 /DNA_ID=CAMNT_0026875873 /DNA_START=84 /DNA_END=1067 /DNA_ORIENTATION=-